VTGVAHPPGGDARLSTDEELAEFACSIYNVDRVSDPRGLSDFLAARTRVAPVLQVRSEGAAGNVCASRVGKETLARLTPAALVFLHQQTRHVLTAEW